MSMQVMISNVSIRTFLIRHYSPVHDLVSNVEFDGFYQSVQHIAGISFSKVDFPLGLFIVLVVRPGN